MTKDQLDANEKAAFVDWRRGLAELQEANDLLITPFERNLEVWRQLWRVVERSDLIVQIVDARNPLLFRSEDLERYVKEVDARKENLLLVNKADLLTLDQRRAWADYFRGHGIAYRFFSAFPDRIEGNARSDEASPADVPGVETAGDVTESIRRLKLPADLDGDTASSTKVDASSEDNEGIEILSPEGLEGLFMKYAPEAKGMLRRCPVTEAAQLLTG
jgi:large subunit GTPase 1